MPQTEDGQRGNAEVGADEQKAGQAIARAAGPDTTASSQSLRATNIAEGASLACAATNTADIAAMEAHKAKLVPVSAAAKQFEPHGGPEGSILVDGELKLGRNVAGAGSCNLPMNWLQISSKHCHIFHTEEVRRLFERCSLLGGA